MADPTFLSDTEIHFGDLNILLLPESGRPPANDAVFYMEKSRPYIEAYRRIRDRLGGRARNILEVGILRGGSAPFLHRFFDARCIICLDRMNEPAVPLQRYQRAQAPDLFRIRYGVDQSDRSRLTEILESDLSEPLDLVVDDASHLYQPTKDTFEAVLPYLRPNGIYVIEDWGWAHSPAAQAGDHFWADQSALTNFCFELTAAYAADSGLISRLTFEIGLMWIERGRLEIPKAGFRLSDYTPMRGRLLGLI